jgi:uncharacterized membrane protein
MNHCVTISIVGITLSTVLIIVLSGYLASSPNLPDMYLPIIAFVFFGLVWFMSACALVYHAWKYYRDRRQAWQPHQNTHVWNETSSINGGPLVPSPSAPPLY